MGAIIHFGTDGWKARTDGDFNEESVVRIADAAGAIWSRENPGAIVYVAYDTRPDADRYARLAAMVLAGHGLAVKISDRYTPTPALSWAIARDERCLGGLMVTGSHSPSDYLGIKLRVSDGGMGTSEFYEELEQAISPDPTDVRGPIAQTDLITPYLDGLVSSVDGEAVSSAHLKLVYDPLYGSARGYMVDVLRVLGVEVAEIHGRPDAESDAIHPEPVEPWVDDCEQTVVETGALAGLVNDGDGDRVGAVDEHGRFVGAQKIIALLLEHLVRNRGASGRVVLNQAASATTRHVAESLSCRVAIKPVGYRHIYEEMLKGGALLGGESTGGIGIPGHLMERDGLYVNLLLCELMAKSGKTLGQLVDELEREHGKYYFIRRDLRLGNEVVEMLRTMLPGINPPEVAGKVPVEVSHMDGIKVTFEDESWLLLRLSGSEQIVRVYAEAPSIEARDELLEAGCSIARGGLS